MPGLAKAREIGAALIITCDCGITAVEPVRGAREAGIQVVVTDHHLPGPELPPADAVVDPQQADDRSGLTQLCGTGFAFKLVQALVPALGLSPNLPLHCSITWPSQRSRTSCRSPARTASWSSTG